MANKPINVGSLIILTVLSQTMKRHLKLISTLFVETSRPATQFRLNLDHLHNHYVGLC